ncbi:MAG: TIGR00282 family metallophosphoesterase [Clostridia bacterium]|nr:TIGR00282 family metallophosphoesterase [Clostridia bacterium]
MNIFAIGDIFYRCGVEHTSAVLKGIKDDYSIDLCIANAENASGSGISVRDYDELTDAGVDVFTLGNHTFGKKDVIRLFDEQPNIIRPANYPDSVPGTGMTTLTCRGKKVGVINLMGRVNIPISLDCPFKTADKCIEKLKRDCDIIVVDFHAEATSEKIAMKYYLDSKVSVLFGTHTHVQTADETVTRGGTGYITDLGMTGAAESVIGVEKEIIIKRFLTGMPQRFEYASGRAALCGAVFEVDDESGKCTSVKRICEK